jgi:glutamine synthetase
VTQAPELTRVLFSDLLGLCHGMTVPSARAKHPTHYAITVMVQGLDLQFLELDGYSTASGFPDMEGRLDETSTRPGWGPHETQVGLADLYRADGSLLPLCVRGRLREMVARWQSIGLDPLAGIEMEAYLLAGPSVADGPLQVPAHRVYGTGPGADPSGLLTEIALAAEASGLGVEGINSEFDAGQVEAAIGYRDALGAADCALLFRELVRETAAARGLGATFMARPFDATVGNGMHLNLSACDSEGQNLFADTRDPDGLSAVCRYAIAGILAHHRSMTALFAPTVNSYKRLRPGMLAGYVASWGLDNRLASVRVPGQRGQGTRIEHRTPDGSASPHLALLAMLAAGLDGIERELPLPPPGIGDVESVPGDAQHTPHSLAEALDELAADDVLTSALGPDMTAAFVGLKRQELQAWDRAVTDWETSTYGRVY